MLIAARNGENGPIPPKLRIVSHAAHHSLPAAAPRGNVTIEHILFVRIITCGASINYRAFARYCSGFFHFTLNNETLPRIKAEVISSLV